LLAYGVQIIIFGISRRSVEVMLRYLQERAGEASRMSEARMTSASPIPATSAKIRGYRSGYLPLQRREIERGLRASGRCAPSPPALWN
jgi:DEAD/DEAH box helicase domain-containing protein